MVTPLSSYAEKAKLPPALLFGYAGFSAGELESAVKRLAQVF